MTQPERGGRNIAVSDLHEDPAEIDRTKALFVMDIINSLRTDLQDGGYASNLVWNTRNTYLGSPGCTFPAEHMQMVVESLLTEIVNLQSQRQG